MLLAASPFYTQNLHMPTRPSPLSERSANAIPRTFSFTMPTEAQNDKKPISQRAHKPNPVIQNRDAVTQRRRDMFFRRVQRGRDDKRWEARGEQIERLDFVSDKKRWEAEKARQAAELDDDYLDEDLLEEFSARRNDDSGLRQDQDISEVDELVLTQEENELEALIASMVDQSSNEDASSQHYGSDDDDFDQIFIECADASDLQERIDTTATDPEDADAMDMS